MERNSYTDWSLRCHVWSLESIVPFLNGLKKRIGADF